MISIVNYDSTYVFDEIGWGDTKFHPHNLFQEIITNHLEKVRTIEFYSKHNVICIKVKVPSHFDPLRWNSSGYADYWFKDIEPSLLNFLCKIPKFRAPVKQFFIQCGFAAFSTQECPLLAAVLLGDNSAVDILE